MPDGAEFAGDASMMRWEDAFADLRTFSLVFVYESTFVVICRRCFDDAQRCFCGLGNLFVAVGVLEKDGVEWIRT
ncbi:unnamed protein product [Calypogeia fissa]